MEDNNMESAIRQKYAHIQTENKGYEMEEEEVSRSWFNWDKFKTRMTPYLFISPFYIAFLVFSAFPIIFSFYLSFHSWNGIRPMEWIGLRNYVFLFTDALFWKSLTTTLFILFVAGIPMHITAILIAFLLNSSFVKLKGFFKSIQILPYITSSVAIAAIFWFLGGKDGPIFYIMAHVFKLPYNAEWFYGPFSRFAVSFIMFWKLTGWNVILYLAGLQAIPKTFYESAQVDGASWPQIFFRISLPLLRPMIYFAVTMSIIALMQLFDEPTALLTNVGGYQNMGMTLVMYTYTQAFNWGFFGRAAAASYMLVILILLLAQITRALFGDKNEKGKSLWMN